jgi:[CysO sulfur-carrier protein]-S-L-cysteine hydrolase
MDVIRVTSAVRRAMLEHARAMIPREAVGVLGGPAPDYSNISISLPNRAGPNAFWADPYAQFKAERQLANSGLQMIAIYHSHPGGGVQMSPLDIMFAARRACIHIVVALARPYVAGEEMQAYRVFNNLAVAVEMYVEGEQRMCPLGPR